MDGKHFFVEKVSDTSADILLAEGLASLLGEILLMQYQTQEGIELNDAGPYFEITLLHSIEASRLPSLSSVSVVLPHASAKQLDKAKAGGKTLDGFDYDGEMNRRKSLREKLSKLPPRLRTPDAWLRKEPELMEMITEEPDTRLDHYQAISSMKIVSSFNELALRWSALTDEQRQLHVALLLTLFSQPENDVAEAITTWQKMAKEQGLAGKALVTALQIVNPTAGKGANRVKASELMIGNQDSFWLLELLKFRGFMEIAAPLVIKESKDRKTYVLSPKHMRLETLQTMMREFRAVLWPTTAIKLDVLASLRFAQILIGHYRNLYQSGSLRKSRGKDSIKSIAHGFEVTSYKDMGSAYATMNVALINLPAWLSLPENQEQAKVAGELLDEHVQVIQNIRNSKGEEGAEEYELLRLYRDFLSGNDLRPFWKFAAMYGSYLMSQRAKNSSRYIRSLSFKGMEKLLMSDPTNNTTALEIVNSRGFKHIANAIRSATVFAQWRRSQFDDRTYEIRYGLGQELMRHARYEKEFLIALSDFLFEYNAETAREEEKAARELAKRNGGVVRPLTKQDRAARNLRSMTNEDDLKEIVALTNTHTSELVGSLLVACGYSFKGGTGDLPKQTSERGIVGE